jgi:predicted ATPase
VAENWLWKGKGRGRSAEITAFWDRPKSKVGVLHRFELEERNYRFFVADELIEDDEITEDGAKEPRKYFFYKNRRAYLNIAGREGGPKEKRGLQLEEINPEKSILAQRSDPEHYPELYRWGETLKKIQIYRDWQFGRKSVLRNAQSPGQPNEYLLDGGENLAVVVNRLKFDSDAKRALMEYLRDFYPWIEDVDLRMEGGKAQVYFHEEGGVFTPATRLSDGTMRWLALLVILLVPNPPFLVCIEEPELGLHPDVIPKLAELLVAASERMQLVVTTHSDILIDALSDHPEAVIVCDKDKDGSHFKRLSAADLQVWLKRYSLGELWRKGELGGNRW